MGCTPEPAPPPDIARHLLPPAPMVDLATTATLMSHVWAAHCLKSEPFYCLANSEIHRAMVTSEHCIDCPIEGCVDGRVVAVGPCVPFLECIPAEGAVDTQECTTDDGQPGTQDVYCSKGFWSLGPCEPPACVPAEEVCNGIDDDCDDGVDENQLNDCGECGPVPLEVCDDVDNDCDGKTDEDLYAECWSACEAGLRQCIGGQWTCSAAQPEPEICDGEDNDCDGAVDEGLLCLCPAEGALFPCAAPPLVCGAGWSQCVLVAGELVLTPCRAICAYTSPGPECDDGLGIPVPEVCNAWDDDCDDDIDEGLVESCYTGPPGTVNVGICKPGQWECALGQWGTWDEQTFEPWLCDDEVVPMPDDPCNGADDDCDGLADDGKEIQPTDMLFVVDGSGSMSEEIGAVVLALQSFGLHYAAEDAILWGLVLAPEGNLGSKDHLRRALSPAPLPGFVAAVDALPKNLNGGSEMTADAIYLAILELAPSAPYQLQDLGWGVMVGESDPLLPLWKIGWRDDVERVVVMLTDEKMQSYLEPKIDVTVIKPLLTKTGVHVFTFTAPGLVDQWAPVSPGGVFKLSSNAAAMQQGLETIIDAVVCAE
ncbi:hypothetical protein CMI37_09465 [Candidatus Pacearchaeota archaeon]|nr:hypothetical protein [Candidatus Pacearchaeota archaeon]